MLRTLKIAIPDDAATRLNELAQREFRRPKDQAGLLLVEAIEAACRVRREREPIEANR